MRKCITSTCRDGHVHGFFILFCIVTATNNNTQMLAVNNHKVSNKDYNVEVLSCQRENVIKISLYI